MGSWELLWNVQLSLAVPYLLVGFRVADVIAVGVATMAPLIGGDGLGREIYSGINFRNPVRMYAGAIPAAMLAFFEDIGLGRLQNGWNKMVR